MKRFNKKCLAVLFFCVVLIGLTAGAIAQTNISNSPGWFSTCPRLAVDPAGNIHVVWAEFHAMEGPYPKSGDAYYSKYDIATQLWSSPVNLSNSHQCYSGEWYCVGIDADGSGNIYVVYIDRPRIMLRILSGGRWSDPLEVGSSPSTDIDSARVAVDASGNIFVSWCDSGYRVVYSRARVGGVWESVARLTYPGAVSKFPEISVGTNQVYCVFQDNHFTPSFYTAVSACRATTFGASWSSPQRMTNAATWEEHPAVRVDANDVAHVIFTPYYDSTASRDVRYVEGTSSGFSAPLVLGTEGYVHFPALAVRGTTVYTCWQSFGVHYRNRAGGAWGAEAAVPDSSVYALTDVATSPSQDKVYYVWDSGSGEIYFSAQSGPGPGSSYIPKNDFNRDGHEDILWRQYGSGGLNVVWFMGDSAIGASGIAGLFLNEPVGEHRVIDMLPEQRPGQVVTDSRVPEMMSEKPLQQAFREPWEAGGPQDREVRESRGVQGQKDVPAMRGAREIKGAGGTGLPVMTIAGLTWTGNGWLPVVTDPNWKIAGTGDFNRDGKADILWRYYGAGGYNAVWYMDGVNFVATHYLPAVEDTSWQIAGTGDFNRDGKVDILWRYYGPGGYDAVWYMDGVNFVTAQYLPAVTDMGWKIEGTGDFNKDGYVDILWRNYGAGLGYNLVWYMNGVNWAGNAWLPAYPDLNWQIAGTGDFNGDGKVDVLVRNYATGENAVWYLDGVMIIGGEWLPAVPDINWRMENN